MLFRSDSREPVELQVDDRDLGLVLADGIEGCEAVGGRRHDANPACPEQSRKSFDHGRVRIRENAGSRNVEASLGLFSLSHIWLTPHPRATTACRTPDTILSCWADAAKGLLFGRSGSGVAGERYDAVRCRLRRRPRRRKSFLRGIALDPDELRVDRPPPRRDEIDEQ